MDEQPSRNDRIEAVVAPLGHRVTYIYAFTEEELERHRARSKPAVSAATEVAQDGVRCSSGAARQHWVSHQPCR
jgi:hypothetical protein